MAFASLSIGPCQETSNALPEDKRTAADVILRSAAGILLFGGDFVRAPSGNPGSRPHVDGLKFGF